MSSPMIAPYQADVYMRMANVVRRLREGGWDYVLVLPAWQYLYHWRRDRDHRAGWSEFFDIDSMSRLVPVMEFDSFTRGQQGLHYYCRYPFISPPSFQPMETELISCS